MGQIGAKRILVLLILGGALAALAVANYFILEPQTVSSRNQLSTVMGETATLQGEVEKMRSDFAAFQQQKILFENISKMGFFNDQDRVLARERFETMQKLSKIISARYEIKAANVINDESAEKTGYVVMESPITVELSAIDDLDIYRFIYFLNYGFPGHIAINNMTIERKLDINPETLKRIGTGDPPEIINAKMDMEWRTMARKDAISAQTSQTTADTADGTGVTQ